MNNRNKPGACLAFQGKLGMLQTQKTFQSHGP